MANTTSDIARTYEAGVEPIFNDFALESGVTVYEGAAVAIDDTANTVGAFAATDSFAGFAIAKAVEGTQTHVKVRSRGIVKLTVAGSPDVGDAVYASDDQTFALTSTDNLQIGKVHRVVSGTTCMVYFEAENLRSA